MLVIVRKLETERWCIYIRLLTPGVLIPKEGAGRHVEEVVLLDPNTFVVNLKLGYYLVLLSVFSNIFSRSTVVGLYLRTFVTKLPRALSWMRLAYLVGLMIGQIIIISIECRRLALLWTRVFRESAVSI